MPLRSTIENSNLFQLHSDEMIWSLWEPFVFLQPRCGNHAAADRTMVDSSTWTVMLPSQQRIDFNPGEKQTVQTIQFEECNFRQIFAAFHMFRLLYFCPLVSHLNLKAKQYGYVPPVLFRTWRTEHWTMYASEVIIVVVLFYPLHSLYYLFTTNKHLDFLCVKNKLSTSVASVCRYLDACDALVHNSSAHKLLHICTCRQRISTRMVWIETSSSVRARVNSTRQNAIILYFFATP